MKNNNRCIQDNQRIAKNTLLLSVRMLLSMLVSFYTSRVVLDVLGINDYGIYCLIGGVAGMFGFLNASLAGATSRFLTFDLGRGDLNKLKQTFKATITVHLLLSLLILILAETIGLWLLENKLVIPEERMNAARILYQLSVFSSILGITQVPYNSAIIAHEKMDIFAYFGMADVIFKLVIVSVLSIGNFDRLILYGVLLSFISLSMMLLYRCYCNKHFEECTFKITTEKDLLKPLFAYSGWDLYGNMSVMARTQGVNILQNLFFGAVINAATGIANQVMNAIMGFVDNFSTALRPQIVKLYANDEINEMEKLAIRCSRFSFYILFFVTFPFFLEAPFVLNVWLKEVPDYAIIFCRLSILFNLVLVSFRSLVFIIHASGKMKRISFINGTLYLMVIPITYILLSLGLSPTTPFFTNIVLVTFGSLSNLYTVKLYIKQFDCRGFVMTGVAYPIAISLLGSIIPCLIYYLFDDRNWISFFIICASCVISIGSAIFFIGMTLSERTKIVTLIVNKIRRICGL